MAQKKKNLKQQKQKQKQHQKQTVIVNVLTSKKQRASKKIKSTHPRNLNQQQQPLITTLPIQYTPYTMYDTNAILTQESINRNRIFQPEIQNAIPIMAEVIGNTPQIIEPLRTQPEPEPASLIPVPMSEHDRVIEKTKQMEKEGQQNLRRATKAGLIKEYTNQLNKNERERKELQTDNQTIYEENPLNKKKFQMPMEKDNSINRFLNPIEPPAIKYEEEEEEKEVPEEIKNAKTDKSSGSVSHIILDDGRYFCTICNDKSIRNTWTTIKNHKLSKKHKENLERLN